MARSPKLLVLTQTHNVWGGIETWMKELFPGLHEAGWDIRFGLARGARFNRPDHFLSEHPYVERWDELDGRPGTSTSRQDAVLGELEKVGADVVMPLAVGDALPAVRRFRASGGKTRMVIPVHSTHAGTLCDVRENGDIVDGIGVVSGLLYRWAATLPGLDPRRLSWIRNGVPPPVRQRVNDGASVLRVGFVGRLEPDVKRARDLLGIARELRRADVAVHIVVAGDGPLAPELHEGLARLGQPFEMLGFVPRKALYDDIYPRLDCLLLTSLSEGSPLAVIEAMRHGVVPVTSRFHGHASEGLLRPDRNGLTFPVGDYARAAACLVMLARNRVLLARLSAAAAADSSSYDSATMISGWDRALRSTLELPQRRLRAEVAAVPRATHGRLERWGLPASMASRVRRWSNRRFLHPSGFDEWPGSVSRDVGQEAAIREELTAIEDAQASLLYANPRNPNPSVSGVASP